MSGIDPSILLQIGQGVTQPQNPLQSMQNALQVASARNALQGSQIDVARNNALLGAQRATGRMYQNAIRPDGAFDQAKFNREIANDTDAAFLAGQNMADSQARQSGQISNQMSDQQLSAARTHATIGLLAPLAANRDASPADAVKSAMAAVSLGLADEKTAGAVLSQMLSNPHGVQAAAAQALQQIQAPQEQLAQVYGTPGTLSDGAHVLAGRYLPASQGGGFVPNTSTRLGLSPETLASQVTITGDDGRPMQMSLGDLLEREGHSVQGQTQPSQGQQQYPWAATGGAYPQAPAQPSIQQQPISQSQPAQNQAQPVMGHAVPVGPDPGTAQAQQMQAQAGADMANEAVRASQGSPERKAILNNMLGELQQFTSGPGMASNGRRIAAAINNTLGTSIDSQGVDAAQLFDKWSTQLAQQQAKTLGIGTDAKLASATVANPNSHFQNATNIQMIHALQGNEDAINAKARAWQESGYHPAQYQQWSAQFNRNFDLQAFQLRRMTPDERTQIVDQMRKAGTLKEFQAKYNRMAAQGLFDNGDQ